MNERDIFLAAIEITDPARRAAYVEQACGSDATLRVQVEELLKTHAQSSQFLETPALAAESAMAQTFVTAASHADEDSHAERASAEAEFRKYLQPATRTGWLGRLGHYEIEAILGRGAFGIVAKAFDEKLHRVVAIKLMNPELAATSPPRKRFLREARTAAAVTHENIVAIHAVEEEPIPYLVMEYIPGQTLQQWLDEHGPLEPAEILRIGRQVAAGLAAAHAANLIHRDIKPSNILMTGGAHERAKISDFGLARAVDDATMTSSGLIAGTPMYMAPEQARGETLDHRADLFSLGSVLYQMASGRPPFRAANTVAVLKRVCEDTPRPLDDVIPGIPGWLETIVFRLLEKDRDDRYQTAQEVADLLARCQSELQHQGHVTSVEGRVGTGQTQVFHGAKSQNVKARKTLIGWLAGGLIALAAVVGLLIMTSGGKKTSDPDLTSSSGNTTSASTTGTPANPTATTGWHGWPADAPPPAIAPFDAEQAKQHQAAWAKYLGVPVEYTNSIGMKFRLIPPGEFLMGSTPAEIEEAVKDVSPDDKHWQECIKSEAPQHRVILTQPIFLGVNEVTQVEYEKVMGTNPSHFAPLGLGKEAVAGKETTDHPVETVSWNDAAEFCAKLSKQAKLKPFYFQSGETITPLDGMGYRLPSEAEWEFACRAGTATKYWIGDKDEDLERAGWFGGNAGGRTHAAGELKANPFGLSDIHGNVWEWVQDGWDATYYGQFQEKPAINPSSPFSAGSRRVIRGGDWLFTAPSCRSSNRHAFDPPRREGNLGFRVSLPVDAVKKALNQNGLASAKNVSWHGWPADAPKPAIAPFDAAQAKKHQEAWAKYLQIEVEYTNALGMKFVLIPPGEFTMGSTPEEIAAALKDADGNNHWQECIKSEAPQHKVILTQPIYLGVNEVTQAEYEKVMGVNPSAFALTGKYKGAVAGLEAAEHPVEMVSWNDAAEFCAKLSKQEKFKPFYFRAGEIITPLDGTGYRLPSEAEWEFACRAGTATKYWIGDKDEDLVRAGWFGGNAGGRTHAAGELKANPFGLFDIHGNVWELVQDGWDATYYGQFQDKPATNPGGPFHAGSPRVIRGGSWLQPASPSRSSHRQWNAPQSPLDYQGFRVSLVVDAVRQSLKVDGAKIVKPGVPVGANGNSVAEQGHSAWDDLDPAQIPEAERVPRQPEGLVAVLGQHRRRTSGGAKSVSVSPDGTQYTLANYDGIHLFDRDLKKPARLFALGSGHLSATFLPDGRLAAFTTDGGPQKLKVFAKPRDGVPLEEQMATIANDSGAQIDHATASSDGHWLVGFDYFDSIGIWKIDDAPPQLAARFVVSTPHGSISPGSFSPDARWFCFTDNGNTQSAVHLIDLRGPTPREATVLKADADEKADAPAKGFEHAAFLSDGRLATADRNGRIWFWQLNDGEPQRVGSIRENGVIYAASKSLRMAAIFGGAGFRVWDLAADPPQLLGSSSSTFAQDNIDTLAIAPDGETVFTGHLNGAVRFWKVSQSGVTELDPLVPNPKNFYGRLKVVDSFLCTSLESSRVGIWRPTRDGLRAVPEVPPAHLVLDAAPALRQLIVRGSIHGGENVLLRPDADRMVETRRITGDNVHSAALSNAGNRLAIGRHNGTDQVVELWGWESDDLPARKLSELQASTEHTVQMAFVEGGRVLVGRVGPHIQIWDVKEDQLIPSATLTQHTFTQFAVTPDGQTLATVSFEGLKLWSLKSDLTKPAASFAVPGTTAVAFSPDGRRLAASFWENGASTGVQIINLASGVVEKRLTFPGRVHELTFTDDSRHLITGNANATIYVVRLQGPPTK